MSVGLKQEPTQWLWAMRALKLPIGRFGKFLYHLLECYAPKVKAVLLEDCRARRLATTYHQPEHVRQEQASLDDVEEERRRVRDLELSAQHKLQATFDAEMMATLKLEPQ